jgi:membrane protease subunit (stomatin/prohibitin family)
MSSLGLHPADLPAKATELKNAMNEALKTDWAETRGLSVGKITLNPITLSDEDMKAISEMEDSATYGSNPFMMAGRMTNATANAMEIAAGNENGAMMGFMGMNMAGNAMGGGFNAAQQFYGMGQQMQQQQMAQQQAAPAADGWKCSCGATATGNFCPNCGGKKPAPQGSWKCSCGNDVTGNFCPNCGSKKPEAAQGWTCSCGSVNQGKFCMNCGAKKPEGAPLYKCDKCGWQPEDPMNPPKFCMNCGQPKPEAWTCACGHAGNKGKFCEECGAKKDEGWDCACGAKKITSKFCPECGAKRPE